MIICDHCKEATCPNYPGPFGVVVSTEGWHHGASDHGPAKWNFDLCKDCAAKLKMEIDKLIKAFTNEI
jgi:hypothetical protein